MQNSEGSEGALKAEATGTEGVGLRRLQGLGTTVGRGPETQRSREGMDRGEKARGADAHASEWRRGGRPPDGGVTLAVLGTRRLQLRREKPRTEAGQAGGGGGAVLLSGH